MLMCIKFDTFLVRALKNQYMNYLNFEYERKIE